MPSLLDGVRLGLNKATQSVAEAVKSGATAAHTTASSRDSATNHSLAKGSSSTDVLLNTPTPFELRHNSSPTRTGYDVALDDDQSGGSASDTSSDNDKPQFVPIGPNGPVRSDRQAPGLAADGAGFVWGSGSLWPFPFLPQSEPAPLTGIEGLTATREKLADSLPVLEHQGHTSELEARQELLDDIDDAVALDNGLTNVERDIDAINERIQEIDDAIREEESNFRTPEQQRESPPDSGTSLNENHRRADIADLERERSRLQDQIVDLPVHLQNVDHLLLQSTSALRADELRQLPVRDDALPDAEALLQSGNYDDHFTRHVDLDLEAAELAVNDFNGGDNHVVTQSIFDPVVSGKDTTIDEYAVTVVLPDGQDPRELLGQLAADMDGTLGGEFARLGDFKNQGDTPERGQVIDIDVKDGPRILDRKLPWAESPFNAPVIISSLDDSSFSVQTIEYNNREHLLHGTREWGFEENSNGSVTFYTRGVSIEDIKAAEGIKGLGNAKDGELRYWTEWTKGIEKSVRDSGGAVVGTVVNQNSGPSGDELWNDLTTDQQDAVRNAQISSHQREIDRLEAEDNVPENTRLIREHRDEIEGWYDR